MAGVPMSGMPMGAIPVGGMPMPMNGGFGTPYPTGNSLMMSGVGSEYGVPLSEPMITPIYDDGRRSVYDYDRGYDSDYYGRGRSSSSRYYDDDDRYHRSSSRASRRSSRRDYDDYYSGDRDYYSGDRDYYDRYGRDYYDRDSSRYYDDYDRYGRRRSSSYYPSSSSSYYSSSRRSSGRPREDISVVSQRDGGIKVLRNGEERISDRVRRMFGIDPKGFNIVRLKRGESIATGIRR